MIVEPKVTWHRLTIIADDIPLYEKGKVITLRPVKGDIYSLDKKGAYDYMMNQYEQKGSPWGWAMSDKSNRVYSCEKLIRKNDNAYYEDGVFSHKGWGWSKTATVWKEWKGSSHRAIFQPREVARFTAALYDVDVMWAENTPSYVWSDMRRGKDIYHERWDKLHPKHPWKRNPLVWVLTLSDFQWRGGL